MKLQPSIDFAETLKNKSDSEYRSLRNSYDHLLKQPLTLGMFIPCDEDGKPLEEPIFYNEWVSELEKDIQHDYDSLVMKNYQQAKEKVLFEGFEVDNFGAVFTKTFEGMRFTVANTNNEGLMPDWNVEYLVRHELTLTPNAIKQIGL